MSQIVLTSDTLASPATAGAIEYTSPVIYATPVGTQRGVMPNAQFYRLDANYVGASSTSAQGVFGVGTGGTGIGVTLSGSTVYAFQAIYALNKTSGTTSHTCGIGFAGTATINNIGYDIKYYGSATGATVSINGTPTTGYIPTASNTTITAAITAASVNLWIEIKGTISVNAGGTFVPQYTLSAAPGGAYTTQAGSYFYIYPIGSAGVINVGTWS